METDNLAHGSLNTKGNRSDKGSWAKKEAEKKDQGIYFALTENGELYQGVNQMFAEDQPNYIRLFDTEDDAKDEKKWMETSGSEAIIAEWRSEEKPKYGIAKLMIHVVEHLKEETADGE